MSKKLFGKFFIFLLVVGLLFAVAPTKQAQAATPIDVQYVPRNGGTVSLSTEQSHSSPSSIKFTTVDGNDGGALRFLFAPGFKLDDITSLSYWEYVTARDNPLDIWIDIWLDYNGDGVLGATEYDGYMQAEPYYVIGAAPLNTWTEINVMNLTWVTYIGEGLPYTAPTIADFQNMTPLAQLNTDGADFGSMDIMRIDIRAGYGAPTWANFTGYADDITINDYVASFTPNEVWVCPTGLCGHSGLDFTTIQAGIDAVAAGGIVNVYPGEYNETATGRYIEAAGPYQFGLFFDSAKPGITLRGVKADGSVIATAVDVAASIKTNATNSFGTSGVFVEADNISITGLEFLDNYNGAALANNKTLEVIGNNFTFKDNVMSVAGGGSLYLNDWSYDSGTGISRFESYNISENLFKFGASVDISSGVGVSGDASGRVIADNTFTADGEDVYWANISFNGTIPSVGWFVDPVGGATITGNTFIGGEMPIRTRGIVEDDFAWASYITGNNFEKAVIAWDKANNKPRAFTYTTSGGTTIENTILIGTVIQDEIGHAQPGDEVRVIKGTFNEAVDVNKAVTIVGTGKIETFTDPLVVNNWYTDRYEPEVFVVDTFLGESVLKHGVVAADFQTNTFYNYQGKKFDITTIGPEQTWSIDLFVDPAWQTGKANAGFWATGFDSAGAVSAYPIVAWRSGGTDPAGFYSFDYINGGWLQLYAASANDYGKWHNFAMTYTVGTGVEYFVDGVSRLNFADPDTVRLSNIILNVYNFGESYNVYWDNFAAHDTKVVGQMSINASDVAIKGLILSNPGQPYGMLIDDAVSNIDITENIFEDIGSPALSQNVKGVYLQYGPDNVLIQNNLFERIHANTFSVNAIFSGDSNSTSPAEFLEIRDNRFLNITSQTKGGYGILLNNGAGNPGAIIDGNRFSGISGGWTHAIGLEGPTADAEVTGNTFYNLTALSPDNLAVFFEKNPVGNTVEVSGNRFQNVGYGVGIHPNDVTTYGYTVDATLNYWGSPCGPAAGVANVGPNVTYNPIYTTVELTTTGAGVSGSYTFPSGSTTEFINTTIACAAQYSTLTFDGSYPGGIIVPADRTDLTFKLSDDTVITASTESTDPGFCFNVFGDHIRIEAENFEYGKPKCVPAGGYSGIYVNWDRAAFGMPSDNEVLDLIIDGLEIDGTDKVQSGITLNYDITDVQILNNYIHNCFVALESFDDIAGRFDVQGNMFKNNISNVLDAVNQNIDASYNSWGVFADPTAGLVGVATYTPWTHMELLVEHVAGSSPWVNQLVSNNTMEITYAVKADMKEITGAEFVLKIPAGLSVKSYVVADVFDFEGVAAVTGGLKYSGAQFAAGSAGSPPVTGQAITLFTVTLTASAPGTYDLTIDETTDAFSMLPPMEPAPSTWVYLDEAHKATLLAIELPEMTTTLTANYEIGVAQLFTVTITNPITGGVFTDPVLVFGDLPAGTTLEYYNGSAWVPFTGVITPDLLNDGVPVVLQFRVTFTAPAGPYPITITLNDSLTTPDEFLARTSGTATVTLLTTPVVGTLSMQGRAYRGDVPMTLTPTTLTGFPACTKFSVNHISDNITFVSCLVGDTYVITTNQPRYLDVTAVLNKTINLLTPDYIITALELKAGDADDSNNIDVSDAGIVGGTYGVGGDVRGDLNFDGKYNIQDLALVGGNYGYDTRTLSPNLAVNPYLNWVP